MLYCARLQLFNLSDVPNTLFFWNKITSSNSVKVLKFSGSTFKPLNPVKRLDKSRKRSRRTTIMGIPNQVQKELGRFLASTLHNKTFCIICGRHVIDSGAPSFQHCTEAPPSSRLFLYSSLIMMGRSLTANQVLLSFRRLMDRIWQQIKKERECTFRSWRYSKRLKQK